MNLKLTWTFLASKPRKNKKRKPGGKIKINGIPEKANGTVQEGDDNPEENEVEESETPLEVVEFPDQRAQSPPDNSHSPTMNGTSSTSKDRPLDNPLHRPESLNLPSPATNRPRTSTINKVTPERAYHEQQKEDTKDMEEQTDIRNTVASRSRKATILADAEPQTKSEDLQGDTEVRLEALARDRALLKEEVSQLRRSLEDIRIKHEEELGSVREQLEDTVSEKDQAETQYRNLLGKVNSIKSQLGERLKADAVSLKRVFVVDHVSLNARKILDKHGVALKSSKSRTANCKSRMIYARLRFHGWQKKQSSGRRSCPVYGID